MRTILAVAGLLILALIIVSASLNEQRLSYKKMNRELIIRNDSILSVNIELNKALNEMKGP